MKLACSALAWLNADDVEAAAVLAASGLAAVELVPTRYWKALDRVSPEEAAGVRDWWREHGMRIVALQSVLHGRPDLVLFGSDDTRDAMSQYLVAACRVASILGAAAVVFGAPSNRRRGAVAAADAERIAIPFFREVGARAFDLGTCLCIEPNPAEYGTDFLNTTAAAAVLVRSVDHPGIRLQLDAGALALAGDDVRREVTDHIALVGHVHASEPHLVPLAAAGPVHPALSAALRMSGYRGHVSLEMAPASAAALQSGLAVLRAMYGD